MSSVPGLRARPVRLRQRPGRAALLRARGRARRAAAARDGGRGARGCGRPGVKKEAAGGCQDHGKTVAELYDRSFMSVWRLFLLEVAARVYYLPGLGWSCSSAHQPSVKTGIKRH